MGASSARSIDKQVQAGRLLILPPRRIGPRITWPKWKAPIGSQRRVPDQPNAWPGMQVLVIGSASAGFIGEAAKRTAPNGKVVVIRPDGEALGRLEKRLAPREFDHLIFETSPAGQIPLTDHSIDRAFLVMGLRAIPSLGWTVDEVHRIVKPEGQLVVHRRFLFAGLLPRQRIISICVDVGFDLVASHAALLHHTLTFEKLDTKDLNQTD